MKKWIALLLALTYMLAMVGCFNADESTIPTGNIAATETEAKPQSEVLLFLTHKYNLKFTLWGPEGHDLYAFYIYPDHAERECHILMPENTDDIAEFCKDLSWEIVDDKLMITGEWQETFRIDISKETATSTITGKVYQIYEMQSPLE